MVNKQPTSLTSTSFPGFFPTRPTERARERPWKTLVTCLPESALSLRRADRREPWERGWLDMSIFSSRWNRGYFKNCRIDHTKQVYISFQISRRVSLGLTTSTIRSQRKRLSFKLFKRCIDRFSSLSDLITMEGSNSLQMDTKNTVG